VRVTVGEAGHDQLTPPIGALSVRKTRHDLVSRTDRRDQVVFDCNGGVEVNGWVALSGYDRGVMNNGSHAALISTSLVQQSAHVEDFLIQLYDLGEIFILPGIFYDSLVSAEQPGGLRFHIFTDRYPA
jgi:hypothetical protein